MAAANNEFFEALSMLEHERGITAEYLIEKIKAAIVIAVKKNYEVEDDNVMVEIDPATGKFNVALLQNVRSQKSGKKDIIKIEGDISGLNFDVLGYVDPQISLTFIENGHVARKVRPDQPKRLVNVIKCTNPRCITSLETGCDHIFALTPSGRYRCVYCEQEFKVRP